MAVDVERREFDTPIEMPALAERAAHVQPHNERRARRSGVFRRRAAEQPERQQPSDRAPHGWATCPLTRAGKCVAAITSSIDLKGSVKWPRPVNTTNRKLSADATTCNTGSETSSNSSRASLRNQSRSALSAAIGPFQ